MASDYEVEILLKIKSEIDKLVQVKKGLKSVNEEAEKGAKKTTDGLRQMLKPLADIRWTVYRMRFLWAASFGAIIGMVVQSSKELERMNEIAGKLGITVEELGKKTGRVFSQTDMQRIMTATREWDILIDRIGAMGLKLQAGIGSSISGLIEKDLKAAYEWQKVAEARKKIREEKGSGGPGFIGSINRFRRGDMDELEEVRQRAGKEWEERRKQALTMKDFELKGELTSKILALQGKETEGALKQLEVQRDQMVRYYGGEDGEMIKIFDEYMELEKKRLEASKWGFQTYYESLASMRKQFGQQTVSLFSDVFIDALDNKLSTAREIFSAFFTDLRNMFIKFMMERAVQAIFGTVMNYFSGGTSGLMSSAFQLSGSRTGIPDPRTQDLGKIVVKGGSNTGISDNFYNKEGFGFYGSSMSPDVGYAEGGWVGLKGKEKVTVGENGPELIVPQTKLRGSSNEGGGQTVNYLINAVDASSFATLVARNPEVILAVTNNAIQKNKTLRKTIKNYA